ncbi:unnamed protein product [marine sediment metagenome]|uniref:Uncharacterized protein n=1 Tax=marine sediment metagenome TaxID=412755 RepID=X0U8R3_9ZZZZ
MLKKHVSLWKVLGFFTVAILLGFTVMFGGISRALSNPKIIEIISSCLEPNLS